VTRPPTGWHFLQLPGPSNVPARVLEAISRATIDHRGPDYPDLTRAVVDGLRGVFRTSGDVVVFPASGTGGWEAAFVNTLSPGDRVLLVETGQFAASWADVGRRFGLDIEILPTDWRRGAEPDRIEERLTQDRDHTIAAVAVVHCETSTGATTRIAEVRAAIDRANHAALLFVDAVSSVGSLDYRHDEWRVDVTIAASQKGLMLPPGLAFHAVSARALDAAKAATLPRSYWDWQPMLAQNARGYFPYTPATNLLFGLREALAMLQEEGLDAVICRHARYGRAARAAVRAWGLETQCVVPEEMSDVLTAVVLPDGHDADRFRALVVARFNMALGTGLGRLAGRVFRIGHLGDMNDLMLLGALAGVESGLALAGVPIERGGVDAAMRSLESQEPVHSGGRLARNAATPSLKSSLP
jgi:alanine-glyoxylate transaminase / serine-glyoxylate transaminase / serine-pyruvate transaminase